MHLEDAIGIGQPMSDHLLALSAFLVSERLSTMILLGPVGSGKSSVIRSLESMGERVVYVPPGTTDDRLFGSTDIEATLKTGRTVREPGLIDEAEGGVLFVDDLDLMEKGTVLELLNRFGDGLMPSDTNCVSKLIATTSKLAAYGDKLLMNRFDVCTVLRSPTESERKMAITDTVNGVDVFDESHLGPVISDARKLIVENTKPILLSRHARTISAVCRSEKVRGQTGPIACARAAEALAALDGRRRTSDEDIFAATLLCLRHRVNPTEEETEPEAEDIERMYENRDILRFIHDDRGKNVNTSIVDKINAPSGDGDSAETAETATRIEEETIVSKVGKAMRTYDISEILDANGRAAKDASTRFVESSKGKYSGSRMPRGECTDLAFDATVRAAAPHQISRNPGGRGIIVRKEDLREKVRVKHVSHTFYFMIDASGSLLIRNRMSKVKATVISMLETHYVKRDRVGIMTFNEDEICVLMAPTKAVEELSQSVEKLKVGCGTPLSAALMYAWREIRTYGRKHPDEILHIILMTDGKATEALGEGEDPCEEALDIAGHLRSSSVDWTVVDTGLGASKTDMPERLAEALDGRLFQLDSLEAGRRYHNDSYQETMEAT